MGIKSITTDVNGKTVVATTAGTTVLKAGTTYIVAQGTPCNSTGAALGLQCSSSTVCE